MTESFVPIPYAQILARHFWPLGAASGKENAYVILDAARDRQIYSILQESDIQHLCLLPGPVPYTLAKSAPYLVQLDQRILVSRWLYEQGWDRGWGIFLTSPATLKLLRSHLQQLLRASDEEGNTFHFRYYDPRILSTYLPTCNDAELRTFFGPVTRFLIPGERPNRLLQFSFSKGQFSESSVKLGERLYIQTTAPNRPPRLYAILDCARNAEIFHALKSSSAKYLSLLPDDTPLVLQKSAPHILQMDSDEPLSNWILKKGWMDHWGIFLSSRSSVNELKQHFASLLRARSPGGGSFLFRFYDPRVMQVYLPTCTKAELTRVFGPTESLLIPDATGVATRHDFIEKKLSTQRINSTSPQRTFPSLQEHFDRGVE